MKKIAIIGANGFVGRALHRQSKNYDYEITCVTRKNYKNHKNKKYDIVINAAMPSRRFWAFNNPIEDIAETIVKTGKIFYEWNYDKFIQISSISANIQSNITYGAHKKAAEVIVLQNKNSMIVRLGALYGKGLERSALFDLINNKHIYVNIESEYNYIDVDFAANWILSHLKETGIKEIGAFDTISLLDVANKVCANYTFEGRFEKIHTNNVEYGMPSAKKVLKYVKKIKMEKNEKKISTNIS